jgi:hypothetical protein
MCNLRRYESLKCYCPSHGEVDCYETFSGERHCSVCGKIINGHSAGVVKIAFIKCRSCNRTASYTEGSHIPLCNWCECPLSNPKRPSENISDLLTYPPEASPPKREEMPASKTPKGDHSNSIFNSFAILLLIAVFFFMIGNYHGMLIEEGELGLTLLIFPALLFWILDRAEPPSWVTLMAILLFVGGCVARSI